MSIFHKTALTLLSTIAIQTAHSNEALEPFCGPSKPIEALDLPNITKVLYSIVSGKAGDKRNWQLMRELFSPHAQITPIFHEQNGFNVKNFTLEEFIKLNKVVFADVDFFETEVNSRIFNFGYTATIISQYESRDKPNAPPYSTGVNSFQLVNDGNRWCVIGVTWDSDKGPFPSSHFKISDSIKTHS